MYKFHVYIFILFNFDILFKIISLFKHMHFRLKINDIQLIIPVITLKIFLKKKMEEKN
jgi:hypothetical protein